MANRLSRNVRLVSISDMMQGQEVINALSESSHISFGDPYGEVILSQADLEGLMDYCEEGEFEVFLHEVHEEVVSANAAETQVFFVIG